MDEWCQKHHRASGVYKRSLESEITAADAESQILKLVEGCGRLTLAGNSVHMDRRFIRNEMPGLDARLEKDIVDVSTVKELVRRWAPWVKEYEKELRHEALSDVRESVGELRYYWEGVGVLK